MRKNVGQVALRASKARKYSLWAAARWNKPRTVVPDGRVHSRRSCLGLPIDELWNTALLAGAGRQDPAEQVQVKDQGDDEYQAPPASRGAEHNDDDGDPNCQQQPDHQR